MSTLFTNKKIIEYSIQEEFLRNNIKYARHVIKDSQIYDLEVLFEINGKNIQIHKHKVDEANAWRLQNTFDLIFKSIEKFNLDLNFFAIINLNDGCGDEKISRITTVGRHKDSNHIGIPDSLSWKIVNNGGYELFLKEDIPFENKLDKIVFRGSDTGKPENNLSNQRLNFCNKYSNSELIDAKITQIVGQKESLMNELGFSLENIKGQPLSSSEQLKNKYLLYIYGNSVSTDRLIWNLASNSFVIQLEPKNENYDYIWYNKFIIENEILPSIKEENFIENFQNFIDQNDIFHINKKQKEFASLFFDKDIYLEYTKEVLIKYNQIFNS